jgi:hypothetical protein
VGLGTIGLWGSVAIAVNTLTGPGMLQLPATFQRSGFIPTTACIICVSSLCSMCALNFANVISKVRDNGNFQKEIEYSDVFGHFWGKRWFFFTQVAFCVCIMCQMMASIVDVAQVVDTYMGSTFTNATSLQYAPPDSNSTLSFVHWNLESACGESAGIPSQRDPKTTCVAFNRDTDSNLLLTSGYVLCMAIFLPMSLMNLKENIFWQVVGFILLILFCFQFACSFWLDYTQQEAEEHTNLNLWGESWSGLFGIVLFNFTVVTAVPAWLYEKEENISVPQGELSSEHDLTCFWSRSAFSHLLLSSSTELLQKLSIGRMLDLQPCTLLSAGWELCLCLVSATICYRP